MKINTQIIKKSGAVLLSAALLAGCAVEGQVAETTAFSSETEHLKNQGSTVTYEVNPEDFSLSIGNGTITVPVSLPGKEYRTAEFTEDGKETRWKYPDEHISVSIKPEEDYLRVTITSETQEDNQFTWPYVSGSSYYLPFGEGKRIPGNDPAWTGYLKGNEFSVLEQLSMPFWAAVNGDHAVLYIMEHPFRSSLVFAEEEPVQFGLSHRYPEIDPEKENSFRIYLTDNDPVSAAKIYRRYIREQGKFVTLEEKAEVNPDIRKLYGAPQIYLWGENLIAPEDINWQAFGRNLDSQAMKRVASLAPEMETGKEALEVFGHIPDQDYVDQYQKHVVCRYISEVLRSENFYDPAVFPVKDETIQALLSQGKESLGESGLIELNKHALAAALPEVFEPAKTWMDSHTTGLVDDMKASGIEQAWIGLNSWEQAYAKPELVERAVERGYLIGPYDSYHSIHKPGEEQWITAAFEDRSLYENAAVRQKNGEKAKGFQNVGRKLNPVLSLPSVKQRVETIMSAKIPFNSWFIDCDATGEIYDDYTPGRFTTQQEDLKARMKRLDYIRDQHNMVIGSEGGNDFAAAHIAFAHGIELKSFSWMDEDMKSNRDSEYYIGKYYNPAGGVAEHFSKRIPVKEEYDKIFIDPEYDIPLFKLVYNDSVITSYHWDWSTFKIKGAVQDRMLREVLYNVPPLYHLDGEEWKNYKEDIVRHTKVWSEFSRRAVMSEMTDFKNLSGDGLVQMTRYGEELTAVANFGDAEYSYGENVIPGHSVLMEMDGKVTVYTPEVEEEHQ
ncbi:MAG: molecular chaperone GroEL [Clostridiaceae bacterium]|nr:molecular chaperone GroEL [Clostridiaceae bacterium]